MKAYWQSLAGREKNMLVFAVGAIILFVFIVAWNLLRNTELELHSQVENHKNLLAWMQQADKKLSVSTTNTLAKTTNQTLAATIQSAINKSNIVRYVAELQQLENNTVQVTLKDAKFDDVILFLNNIWLDNNLVVFKANIKRSNTAGVVNGIVVIKLA